MEKSISGNFFCRNRIMNVCNFALFVCTFTNEKHKVLFNKSSNMKIAE